MRKSHLVAISLAAALAVVPAAALAVDIGTLHCNDVNGVPLLMNTVVTVQGVITANQPTGTNNRLYIQDATGGINVFGTVQNCALAVGDLIEVTGTIIHFNGLAEVASTATLPLAITVLSSGNPQPIPLLLTIPQVEGTYQLDDCEPNESKVIKAIGLVRTSTGAMPAPGATFAANTNYRLISAGPDSATVFTTVRVVQSSNACGITNSLVGRPIPLGCAVEVVGVLSQFDSSSPYKTGYQILPADMNAVYCTTVAVEEVPWTRVKRLYRD
jgi:hypothetical protein